MNCFQENFWFKNYTTVRLYNGMNLRLPEISTALLN